MKLAAALAFCASACCAETDFEALSDGERLLLGQEIRAVLLAHPDIIEAALNPVFEPYAEDIATDLELIAKYSAVLFGRADMAFIVGDDCPDCASAQEELAALTKTHGLTVNTLDISQAPELASALGIDTLPFYVLPRLMLRGAMPSVVLERYLSEIAD